MWLGEQQVFIKKEGKLCIEDQFHFTMICQKRRLIRDFRFSWMITAHKRQNLRHGDKHFETKS